SGINLIMTRLSNTCLDLHAPTFRRTAAVVRNRRGVLDGANFDTGGRQGSDSRFATGARTGNPDFDDAEAAIPRLPCRGEARLLGGEGGTFSGAAETEGAGARPGKDIADLIGNSDDGVVEGRLDVDDAHGYVLLFLLFEGLLLGRFCGCLGHSSVILR